MDLQLFGSSKRTVRSEVQPQKACFPISKTVGGMAMCRSDEQ